jgi:hypothetical protein
MRSHLVALALAASAVPLSLLARADPPAANGGTEAVAGVDAGPPPGGYAPDPVPLLTRHQWVVELGYRAGAVVYGGARRIELTKPMATRRAMGRFAIELLVGKELVDRVRFDFPLLGADELAGAPRRWDSPPSFERNLSTSVSVLVPQSERATRAVLVDRATGHVWPLPWPMVTRTDAGAPGG